MIDIQKFVKKLVDARVATSLHAFRTPRIDCLCAFAEGTMIRIASLMASVARLHYALHRLFPAYRTATRLGRTPTMPIDRILQGSNIRL